MVLNVLEFENEESTKSFTEPKLKTRQVPEWTICSKNFKNAEWGTVII